METAPPPSSKVLKPLDPRNDWRFAGIKEANNENKEKKGKEKHEGNQTEKLPIQKMNKQENKEKKNGRNETNASFKGKKQRSPIKLTTEHIDRIINQVEKGMKKQEEKSRKDIEDSDELEMDGDLENSVEAELLEAESPGDQEEESANAGYKKSKEGKKEEKTPTKEEMGQIFHLEQLGC